MSSPASDVDSLDVLLRPTNPNLMSEAHKSASPIMHMRNIPVIYVADDEEATADIKGEPAPEVKPRGRAITKRTRGSSSESLSPFNSDDERMLDHVLSSAHAVTPPRQSSSADTMLPTPPSSSPSNKRSTAAPNGSPSATPSKRPKTVAFAPIPAMVSTGTPLRSGKFSAEEDLAIFRHLQTGKPWSALAPNLNRQSNSVATRAKNVIEKCEAMLGKGSK